MESKAEVIALQTPKSERMPAFPVVDKLHNMCKDIISSNPYFRGFVIIAYYILDKVLFTQTV